MYKSIRAQRSGKNLTDYSHSGMGFNSSGTRKSLQLKLEDNSYTKNANYAGTKYPDPQAGQLRKVNTLGKAIAEQEALARRSKTQDASDKYGKQKTLMTGEPRAALTTGDTRVALTDRGATASMDDLRAATQNDLRAATHSDLRAPTHSDLRAATQNDLRSPTQNNLRGATQHDLRAPTQSDLRSPTQNNLRGATQNDLRAPTQNNLRGATQHDLRAPTQNLALADSSPRQPQARPSSSPRADDGLSRGWTSGEGAAPRESRALTYSGDDGLSRGMSRAVTSSGEDGLSRGMSRAGTVMTGPAGGDGLSRGMTRAGTVSPGPAGGDGLSRGMTRAGTVSPGYGGGDGQRPAGPTRAPTVLAPGNEESNPALGRGATLARMTTEEFRQARERGGGQRTSPVLKSKSTRFTPPEDDDQGGQFNRPTTESPPHRAAERGSLFQSDADERAVQRGETQQMPMRSRTTDERNQDSPKQSRALTRGPTLFHDQQQPDPGSRTRNNLSNQDEDGSAPRPASSRAVTRGPTLFHDGHQSQTQTFEDRDPQDSADKARRLQTRGPTLFHDSHTRAMTQAMPDEEDNKPMTRGKTLLQDPSGAMTRGKTLMADAYNEDEAPARRGPSPSMGRAKTDMLRRSPSSDDRGDRPVTRKARTMGGNNMSDNFDDLTQPRGAARSNSLPPERRGTTQSPMRTKSRFTQGLGAGIIDDPNASTDIEDRSFTRSFTTASQSPMQLSRGGERATPKKWSSPLEKIHGGHYEYIVGHRERTADDDAKRELDQDLLAMLSPDLEQPSPPCSPKRMRNGTPGTTSAPAMRTAFTDRTLRLRDDLGKTVLRGKDDEKTQVPDSKDCDCSSCQPFHRPAAGLPSTLLPGNKVSKPTGERKGLKSELVGTAIHKMFEDEPEKRPEWMTEEMLLKKQFGIRSRARSADPTAAGGYNMTIGRESPTRRGRMDWQPKIWEQPHRSELAMALNPGKDDVPPSMRITQMSKGAGEFKTPSDEAEHLSIKWNQPLYRFELCAGEEYRHPRATSMPPPRRRNPVNNDGVQLEDNDLGNAARGDRKTRGLGNDSANMNLVTNAKVCKDLADRERTMRLQHDKNFASACQNTSEAKEKQAQIHGEIIAKNHHSWSGNMADTLKWDP